MQSNVHSPLRTVDSSPRDESRWDAVVSRDGTRDDEFVYGVLTTGIFCRPSCPSRQPLRKNVRFFESADEARLAGLRACRRCTPDGPSRAERDAALIAEACRMLERAEVDVPLDALAEKIGLSPYHFHRLFKAQTGVTPKAYARARREQRVRSDLGSGKAVTDALYAAGYGSSSSFYSAAQNALGMRPDARRRKGAGETIRFALGQCFLGSILVAASDQGICAIALGDDPQGLLDGLQEDFSNAKLIGGDSEFEALVASVVALVEDPSVGTQLPLDVRGTAFQKRVWDALAAVPAGRTASYADIARSIGRPRAVRAVAQACGANRLAVAIPCHRVVRSDGGISGYRWGVERKRALLAREGEVQ